MSSIAEAIYKDVTKGKVKPNFVALTSSQERKGETTADDFHQRCVERRAEERAKRLAEGGRGGGFNDRQEPVARKANEVDEGGLDEFGRRKSSSSGEAPVSKSARAQAALERL